MEGEQPLNGICTFLGYWIYLHIAISVSGVTVLVSIETEFMNSVQIL